MKQTDDETRLHVPGWHRAMLVGEEDARRTSGAREAPTNLRRPFRGSDWFAISPARTSGNGDHARDLRAGVNWGRPPSRVSHGVEGCDNSHPQHEFPTEVISPTPEGSAERVLHALELAPPPVAPPGPGRKA
jgi:hypothetical protein